MQKWDLNLEVSEHMHLQAGLNKKKKMTQDHNNDNPVKQKTICVNEKRV